MNNTYIFTALIITGIFTLLGCQNSKDGNEASIRNSAIQFASGVSNFNSKRIKMFIYIDSDMPEYSNAILNYYQSIEKFRDSFIKHYGKDSWENFNNPGYKYDSKKDKPSMQFFIVPEATYRKNLSTQPIKYDSKKQASIEQFTGGGGELYLILVNNEWKASFVDPQSTKEYKNEQVVKFNSLSELLDKYTNILGHSNYTWEDIDYQLALDYPDSRYYKSYKWPKLFDIDQLLNK